MSTGPCTCAIKKYVRAEIALQQPARLLQRLFYFIAHETTPLYRRSNTVVQLNCCHVVRSDTLSSRVHSLKSRLAQHEIKLK